MAGIAVVIFILALIARPGVRAPTTRLATPTTAPDSWALAPSLGLRQGETLGLTWDDVNRSGNGSMRGSSGTTRAGYSRTRLASRSQQAQDCMNLNAVKVIPACGREIRLGAQNLVGQETSLLDVAPRAYGRSGDVGFEADGAEVVTGGEADVGVQSSPRRPRPRGWRSVPDPQSL